MEKQITLEIIDTKEENNNERLDSDDNDIYEQDFNIKNPKIPDSLRTPEPSQKRILEIKKKQSKLDISQIDLNSEANIYSSRNSNTLGSFINNYEKNENILKKSKTSKRIKIKNKHSGFINKNSSKNIVVNKVYSYRRPFSKKKRKFIFVLICLINILINLDKGAIPAGTTEIKEKNNMTNAELGMIG